MAYAISRASKTTSILLLVIILPFWTSFLLRVYALEGIIRDGGILNTVLLRLGLISHPLQIAHQPRVYLGIIYSYLPFMVLPCSRRSRNWTTRCWKPRPIWAVRPGGPFSM